MYALSKTPTSIETAQAIVAAHFGGQAKIDRYTELTDGMYNAAYLIELADGQKSVLTQCLQIATEMWQSRLLILEEQQEPLPVVFLVVLIFWLALLFLSFGLFAPRNTTVFAVLLVCALSVASAVFLILEMNHPLDGSIQVSSAPLIKALELIGQ